MYVYLLNITNPKYTEKLRGKFPPPSQNNVLVCNQNILLILYHISPRPVTFLKVIDAPVEVPNIFYHTVSFKLINFSFQIFLLFVPEMSASFTSYIVSYLHCSGFVSCTRCILVFFLGFKKHKHFSSNHGLCCFNSCKPNSF